METISLKTTPSDKEIEALEQKLAQMKFAKDQARKAALAALKSEELINSLTSDEALFLIRKIQSRLSGNRKSRRGAKVSRELKNSLKEAILDGSYSLSQLQHIFNLSISYISKVKKEMRDSGELTMNAYEDRQLIHQQAAA